MKKIQLFSLISLMFISLSNAQWSIDPFENNPISTETNNQYIPPIISDGSGGAIITWDDFRNGSDYDIYAQRINSSGEVQWTSNGVPISMAANEQSYPKITSDGSGGAIITWQDFRNGSNPNIYAQKVSSAGLVQWTA